MIFFYESDLCESAQFCQSEHICEHWLNLNQSSQFGSNSQKNITWIETVCSRQQGIGIQDGCTTKMSIRLYRNLPLKSWGSKVSPFATLVEYLCKLSRTQKNGPVFLSIKFDEAAKFGRVGDPYIYRRWYGALMMMLVLIGQAECSSFHMRH